MDEENLTKKEKRQLAKEKKKEEQSKKKVGEGLKRFFVWAISAVLLIFVGVKGYNWVTAPTPQVNGTSIEVSESDWVRGNREAEVTLVEFGDFECPACVNYYPLVKQLKEDFPDDLRVVYKQYPLVTIHKNAFAAAKATEAAGLQGKFWEMHDLLYERNSEWVGERDPKSKFEEFATEIGLDIEKYKSDFDSEEVEKAVNEDLALGTAMAVNSTPTFILNGTKVQPRSYEQFKSFVEDQIKGYTLE